MAEFTSRPSKVFDAFRANLRTMKGKTLALTGCTSGTGYVCAREAVASGGRVLALNRPSSRAANALASLKAHCNDGGSIEQIDCDLGKLSSVAAAATAVTTACGGSLDQLVCNAGIMGFPQQLTDDGYEIQMQSNHLGHWLLIRSLMPCLEAAAANGEARIILHSSGAALKPASKKSPAIPALDSQYLKSGGVTTDADGMGDGLKARFRRYQQSKLAQLVAGTALSEALVAKGSSVKVLMCNPGLAATGLIKKLTDTKTSAFSALGLMGGVFGLIKGMIPTMEEGAIPLMVCVFRADVSTGEFWAPRRRVKKQYKSKQVKPVEPVNCMVADVLIAERGPNAWDVIHDEAAKTMCIELSDAAVSAHLK